MKIFFAILAAFLLTPRCTRAQKANLHVRLIDSSAASPSDYIFELEVRNDGFPIYWVEDTATIKTDITMKTALDLCYVLVGKYGVKGRELYERVKVHRGDPIPEIDPCAEHCCNCEILKKGQSFKINLKLVANYILEKGHYFVEVNMHPPAFVCHVCKQLEEISTDYDFWVR